MDIARAPSSFNEYALTQSQKMPTLRPSQLMWAIRLPVATIVHIYHYHLLGRLRGVDLITLVGLKCPYVRPSTKS